LRVTSHHTPTPSCAPLPDKPSQADVSPPCGSLRPHSAHRIKHRHEVTVAVGPGVRARRKAVDTRAFYTRALTAYPNKHGGTDPAVAVAWSASPLRCTLLAPPFAVILPRTRALGPAMEALVHTQQDTESVYCLLCNKLHEHATHAHRIDEQRVAVPLFATPLFPSC
jgi:hypothetical protein